MTTGAISGLVVKALKNPKFLQELISERDRKEKARMEVADVVKQMNIRDEFIDSAAHIKKELEVQKMPAMKEHVIRSILRKDLRMRFKKVVSVALTANSHRNLILRQQFALKFLDIDLEKKVVVSIDESWCGMSDFRHRKWCQQGQTNSVAKLQILPRISMIAAISSTGDVYLSLVQANSNSKLMKVYFRNLAQLLDLKHPGWRKTHVWLMDNVKYHRSAETMKILEELQVPIIFTGPHSYDAARKCPDFHADHLLPLAAELLFAHFKAVDINPRKVKTGRK